MHGSRSFVNEFAPALSGQLKAVELQAKVVIIPPALLVCDLREQLLAQRSDISWGVQNIASEALGAYTGEISAGMARDQGCTYCILGHSERRQLFGETDALVADKVVQAVETDLTAIVCVGETLAQRENGEAKAVVARQVESSLAKVTAQAWDRIIVAYEPVWAIGTGKTASAADAQAIHASIRKVLENMQAPAAAIPLLYGGSIKPENAKEMFAQPDIDGGLIGGASLDAKAFAAICQAC